CSLICSFFFFSSRRRHTRFSRDWSSDVCSSDLNSITLPSFLESRFRDNTRLLRIASGLIILVFFTFYVSSGMVAGGVFFEASFGTHYLFGMLLVAGITLTYTLFGGF